MVTVIPRRPSRTGTTFNKLTAATLNVKFDGERDEPVPIPESGAVPPSKSKPWESKYRQHPWAERRSRMIDALLASGDLDIVGFQEVYHNQLNDIAHLLGPTYGHVGVGRDDGKRAGEYSPIFYDRTKFELVKWKTIWLSPRPDVPGSKGWDANLTRIATLLTLKYIEPESALSSDSSSVELVHAICTHWDDSGVKARAESAVLIREKAYEWAHQIEHPLGLAGGEHPIVLLGDFNSPPEEYGYKTITSSSPLPNNKPSVSFSDAYTCLSTRRPPHTAGRPRQSQPYGAQSTYTGFSPPGKDETKRIDFVMIGSSALRTGFADAREMEEGGHTDQSNGSGKGEWEFTRYAVVDNWVEEGDKDGWEGRWSDHRAVRVTIERR